MRVARFRQVAFAVCRHVGGSISCLALLPLLAVFEARAQGSGSPWEAGVPPARLAGTMELRPDARDSSGITPYAVTGTATWRLETDTANWRRKVTLRLTIDGPEPVEIVVRAPFSRPPASAAVVPAYSLRHQPVFVASMTAREQGDAWTYSVPQVGDVLHLDAPVAPTDSLAVLRGQLLLMGFHNRRRGRSASWLDPQTRRTVRVTFAATFDSQPAPVPAMRPGRQRQILADALYDFAKRSLEGGLQPVTPDSTRDAALARAYLLNRWSDAATVDTVIVGPKGFYVRLRGRVLPVTCEFSSLMGMPNCPPR